MEGGLDLPHDAATLRDRPAPVSDVQGVRLRVVVLGVHLVLHAEVPGAGGGPHPRLSRIETPTGKGKGGVGGGERRGVTGRLQGKGSWAMIRGEWNLLPHFP